MSCLIFSVDRRILGIVETIGVAIECKTVSDYPPRKSWTSPVATHKAGKELGWDTTGMMEG